MSRYVNIDGERVKLPLFPGEILSSLLDRLRENQSFCPYCSSEHCCQADCVLDGIWFKRVEGPEATQLPDVDPDCECVGQHTDECPWTDL